MECVYEFVRAGAGAGATNVAMPGLGVVVSDGAGSNADVPDYLLYF